MICSTIPTAQGSGVSEEDQNSKTHHLQVHLQKKQEGLNKVLYNIVSGIDNYTLLHQ